MERISMLTSNEISALCGLPLTTLTDWVAKGIVQPVALGAKGRGKSSRFSPDQALGLAVAAGLHNSERGCNPKYAGEVVRQVGRMDQLRFGEWLNGIKASEGTRVAADIVRRRERVEGRLRK
jgi:hypothetical protein